MGFAVQEKSDEYRTGLWELDGTGVERQVKEVKLMNGSQIENAKTEFKVFSIPAQALGPKSLAGTLLFLNHLGKMGWEIMEVATRAMVIAAAGGTFFYDVVLRRPSMCELKNKWEYDIIAVPSKIKHWFQTTRKIGPIEIFTTNISDDWTYLGQTDDYSLIFFSFFGYRKNTYYWFKRQSVCDGNDRDC